MATFMPQKKVLYFQKDESIEPLILFIYFRTQDLYG